MAEITVGSSPQEAGHLSKSAAGGAVAANSERRGLWKGVARLRSRPPVRHIALYEQVLGTALELQVAAESATAAQAAEAAALREIDRLELIFSAYRADSELSRWQNTLGSPVSVSPELAQVLHDAEEWRVRTGNAFHPAVESLTRQWRAASDRGAEPDAESLRATVAEMAMPLWKVDAERRTAIRLTRLPATLNAIAKGFILDRACMAAMRQPGVRAALLNIGGDIRQAGGNGAPVGIADPFAPHENASLLETVRLREGGIATSGNYRRGFQVAERWLSHLIDPRTGYPVEEVVSASVLAGSAQEADVLATAFSVLRPHESLVLAESLPEIGVLLVEGNGIRHSNLYWQQRLA